MTNPESRQPRMIRIALVVLSIAPASALAHNGSHAEDPNLHVDPTVKECEVRFDARLTQEAFRRFAREFGSVSAFKQGAAPNTLGKWHVSVGLEYMSFGVEEKADAWNDTFVPDKTHELGSRQAFPKFKVRLGVTDDTDLGIYFTRNPESNYGWIGFDVRHALLKQGTEMPVTLSLRGAYTKTLFVSDMDMHALSAGASVGRTFWNVVTPYFGVGADAVLARETASTVDLRTEATFSPHAFAGVEVAFWHLALGVEAQLAGNPSAQAQVSVVF